MEQKNLSVLMKIAVILMGIVGIVCYADIIPIMGKDIAVKNPEFAFCFWPWLIFLELTAISFYTILVLGWLVSSEIGKDRSFSVKNSKMIKAASIITMITSVYFFAGNVLLFFAGMSHPGVLLASIVIVFIGFAFGVGFAMLSHLIMKAAKLQEQNDLTI